MEFAGPLVLLMLALSVVIAVIPLVLLDMAFRLIGKRTLWHPAIGIIISIPLIIAAAAIWVNTAALLLHESGSYAPTLLFLFSALLTTGAAFIFLFSFRFRRIENISFWHPAIISILSVPVIFAAFCFLLSMVFLFSYGLAGPSILLLMYALLIAYLTLRLYRKSLAIEQD
jgi:hypothetical protein